MKNTAIYAFNYRGKHYEITLPDYPGKGKEGIDLFVNELKKRKISKRYITKCEIRRPAFTVGLII